KIPSGDHAARSRLRNSHSPSGSRVVSSPRHEPSLHCRGVGESRLLYDLGEFSRATRQCRHVLSSPFVLSTGRVPSLLGEAVLALWHLLKSFGCFGCKS